MTGKRKHHVSNDASKRKTRVFRISYVASGRPDFEVAKKIKSRSWGRKGHVTGNTHTNIHCMKSRHKF